MSREVGKYVEDIEDKRPLPVRRLGCSASLSLCVQVELLMQEKGSSLISLTPLFVFSMYSTSLPTLPLQLTPPLSSSTAVIAERHRHFRKLLLPFTRIEPGLDRWGSWPVMELTQRPQLIPGEHWSRNSPSKSPWTEAERLVLWVSPDPNISQSLNAGCSQGGVKGHSLWQRAVPRERENLWRGNCLINQYSHLYVRMSPWSGVVWGGPLGSGQQQPWGSRPSFATSKWAWNLHSVFLSLHFLIWTQLKLKS